MDRTILHCDCNSFFASVETLLDPSLADGPTAVCGDPESRHGIIRRTNCRDHLAGETEMPGFTAGSTASERICEVFAQMQ